MIAHFQGASARTPLKMSRPLTQARDLRDCRLPMLIRRRRRINDDSSTWGPFLRLASASEILQSLSISIISYHYQLCEGATNPRKILDKFSNSIRRSFRH